MGLCVALEEGLGELRDFFRGNRESVVLRERKVGKDNDSDT